MLFDQLQVAQEKIEELNREQESLIDIFAEERDRRENEEKVLKKKLQVRCPPPCFYCFSFLACRITYDFISPVGCK